MVAVVAVAMAPFLLKLGGVGLKVHLTRRFCLAPQVGSEGGGVVPSNANRS